MRAAAAVRAVVFPLALRARVAVRALVLLLAELAPFLIFHHSRSVVIRPLARATTALESKSRGFSSASFDEAMVGVEVDRSIDENSAANLDYRLSTRPRPRAADRETLKFRVNSKRAALISRIEVDKNTASSYVLK